MVHEVGAITRLVEAILPEVVTALEGRLLLKIILVAVGSPQI